jgi:hypothetical protein
MFGLTIPCDPRRSLGTHWELVAIDAALNALAEIDSRKARVVELCFSGGERGRDSGGSEDFAAKCDETRLTAVVFMDSLLPRLDKSGSRHVALTTSSSR